MNIAYFTDSFLPEVNGVASHVAILSEELGKRGHKVRIFTPQMPGVASGHFSPKNVQVHCLPAIPSFVYPEHMMSVFGIPVVLRTMKEFKPDIIHTHTPLTVGFDAMIYAKLYKIPLAGTFHLYYAGPDYIQWMNFIKGEFSTKVLSSMMLSFCRTYYEACDIRFSPSTGLIKDLYALGFKKKIHYLPNPLSSLAFQTITPDKTRKLKQKWNLKKRVIIYSGRLSEEKKVDQLIHIFSEVLKKYSDTSLLLIGDGPSKKKLTAHVVKLGLQTSVVFTGFIPYHELLRSGLLSVGNVYATASPMETRPMSVVEAMAAGLPIVGVKKAGMIELVDQNGYLVAPNNREEFVLALIKILGSGTLQEKMGALSKKRAETYSVIRVVDNLVREYKKVV